MKNSEYLKKIIRIDKYNKGNGNDILNNRLQEMYECKKVYLFSNARSAQYLFLKALGIKNDGVLVQSFTCNSAVSPILWSNNNPIYVDIDRNTYCMDFDDVKKKYTDKCKVLIAQHTFGYDGLSERLYEFGKSKGLYILEDCAHCFGNTALGKKGDASIISFGIAKIMGTRVGGALIVNNKDLITKIDIEYERLENMSLIENFMWLINPIIWRILRKLGIFEDILSKILNSVGLLNMGFLRKEYAGEMPTQYPRKLSNVLSEIILDQIKDLPKNLTHRKNISNIYSRKMLRKDINIPLVRYPLVFNSLATREEVILKMNKNGVTVGYWYDPFIYPRSTKIENFKYEYGSCPIAEFVSKRIINIPTGINISEAEAQKIIDLL